MKKRLSLWALAALLSACGGGSDEDNALALALALARASEGDSTTSGEKAAPTTPAQRQVARSFTSLDGSTTVPFLEYLPADYASTRQKRYPLLVFLHGGGGAGTSNGAQISKLLGYPIPALIASNHEMCFADAAGVAQCFIVVSPQSPRTTGVWNLQDTAGMLEHALNTYRVDPKRVYVTGVSMGGGGTWNLMASSYSAGGLTIQGASRITAAVPIASGAPSNAYHAGICNGIVAKKVAVWAFHNSGDPVAALANEQGWVNKVNLSNPADGYTCAQAGQPAAQLTVYPGNTHEGWTTAYNVSTQITPGMNAFQWLLSHRKP